MQHRRGALHVRGSEHMRRQLRTFHSLRVTYPPLAMRAGVEAPWPCLQNLPMF
jgi:hypothetical protein